MIGRLLLSGMVALGLVLSVMAGRAPATANPADSVPIVHVHTMDQADTAPARQPHDRDCAGTGGVMACCSIGHCMALAALPTRPPAQPVAMPRSAAPFATAAPAPDGVAPGPALRPPQRTA